METPDTRLNAVPYIYSESHSAGTDIRRIQPAALQTFPLLCPPTPQRGYGAARSESSGLEE